MARTRSQQVKVSLQDRELIVALAKLDGVTPSSWCYHAIMKTVEAQRDRLRGPGLRLVPDQAEPSEDIGSTVEPTVGTVGADVAGETPPSPPLAYSEA